MPPMVVLNARLADFANVNLSGSMSTIGFGSIDQSLTARQKYDAYQYDFSSTFALGNFFGKKPQLKYLCMLVFLKLFKTHNIIHLDPDITLKSSLDELQSNEEKEELKDIAQDLTKESLLTLLMSEKTNLFF